MSGVECFTLSNRHQWVKGGESGGVVQRTGSLGLGHTNKNKVLIERKNVLADRSFQPGCLGSAGPARKI